MGMIHHSKLTKKKKNGKIDKVQVFLEYASRSPEFQQAILAVSGDQVLVRVVSDADHILLMDLRRREMTF